MPCTIIVGTQWGDEGKGKIVDLLTSQAKHIVRSQGGNNAGHTVIVRGKEHKLHLVPSGILHPHTQCYIGAGTVIDPETLIQEMGGLRSAGIFLENRLWISPEAHVIMPYHRQLDSLSEKLKGAGSIGTTGRGIGPAYADKANRIGIRVSEWIRPSLFAKTLQEALVIKNAELAKLYDAPAADFAAIYQSYTALAAELSPYVADVEEKIHKAISSNESVLLEGAQGTFLDITSGTYPFVTSSSTTAAGICSGAGIGPRHIDHVLGVVKAYTTRVGKGPFPTEIPKEALLIDRKTAREFGTTTGRERRIGWFDACLLKRAVQLNGIDSLAITKLDVLDQLDVIKIATGYTLNGVKCSSFPKGAEDLAHVVPIYEEMPGWKQPTHAATSLNDLPPPAQRYLKRIEELCGMSISIVSVGPDRQQTIVLNDIFAKTARPL
jgi:adenylosuccinate synthase